MKKYFLNKMSTGKRLAKRSIIGMRVCALSPDDGLYYPGRIHAVKTPDSPRDNQNCINLTPNTRYSVRFDPNPVFIPTRRALYEFSSSELIGDGFGNITDVKLKPGQKVYVTNNGRETCGIIVEHDVTMDEVTIQIQSATPNEAPFELVKKLEEVRLSESRRSPRLADQERDTDFARLADMAGDRRRSSSHSIDVPMQFTQNGSRKRRTSYTQDEREYLLDGDDMDECNAALVLMSLSCSPNSPRQAWESAIFGTSPGDSIQSSSYSGSSSPPLSDDGNVSSSSMSSNEQKYIIKQNLHKLKINQHNVKVHIRRGQRTTSLSASDEGIVMDYGEEMARKRRTRLFKCTWKNCGLTFAIDQQVKSHVRNIHLGPKNNDDEDFYFTDLEDEDEAIETDTNTTTSPPLPPTLSHSDMARPPHEDPEYQRKIVGNIRQGLLMSSGSANGQSSFAKSGPITSGSNTVIHNYAWSQTSPTSPQKHVKLSPRPSTSYAPYTLPSSTYSSSNYPVLVQQYHSLSSSSSQASITKLSHSSPPQLPPPPQQQHTPVIQTTAKSMNSQSGIAKMRAPGMSTPLQRRTRGENKKCRKVYGMDNRDSWCTQCKWKKACSRFGD